MSTDKYDVIVVFGSKIQGNQRFPEFVYLELSEATQRMNAGQAPLLALCGNRAMDDTRPNPPVESDIAARYVERIAPNRTWKILQERRSTNFPENWLYLKLLLMKAGIVRKGTTPRILHIIIEPLLPRARFLGDMIFGDDAKLSFVTLPWARSAWPNEPRLLDDARCTLLRRNRMKRGDHRFLLNADGESRWDELRTDHRKCPYYKKVHPPIQ